MYALLTRLLTIEIPFDPNLFSIGGLDISWHGVFTALGVIAGVSIAVYFGLKAGINEDHAYNIALTVVVGGIIGARVLYVMENWSRFDNDLGEVFALNAGGISIYGALIGGTLFAWIYCLLAKVPNIPVVADVGALGGIVGMAIGRIGDIINGEHYAKATDLPWAVRYTDAQSPGFYGNPLGQGVATHPVVAYELLADIAIFAVLYLIYRRVNRPGVTFFSWAILYAAVRLPLSFLRLDDTVLWGLRMAQVVAIIVLAISIPALYSLLFGVPRPRGPSRAQRRRVQRVARRRSG
jgi:phosphatidylglycerol:prolipoprotein diacylglycerol transferase